jgi:hypothetical protein
VGAVGSRECLKWEGLGSDKSPAHAFFDTNRTPPSILTQKPAGGWWPSIMFKSAATEIAEAQR